jgi:hypothetical protein
MGNFIFIRELKVKLVRKMGAGERALGRRKPGARGIDRVVHRMHRGCTEEKRKRKARGIGSADRACT